VSVGLLAMTREHLIKELSFKGECNRCGDGFTSEGEIVEHTNMGKKQLSPTFETYHKNEFIVRPIFSRLACILCYCL
jgi:hypothetical protein